MDLPGPEYTLHGKGTLMTTSSPDPARRDHSPDDHLPDDHPLRDHPLRKQLADELHARPFATVTAPTRVSHLALYTAESSDADGLRQVEALCERFGAPPPDRSTNHLMIDFGRFRLKWERHGEFSSYSIFAEGAVEGPPFADTALSRVPADWLAGLPGERLVGLHAEVLAPQQSLPDNDTLKSLFGNDNFAGAMMTGGAAAAWTDFAIQPDGFTRLLIQDRHLRPRQAGRLLQRLFEIETYRMMALLALPLARQVTPELNATRDRLVTITAEMTRIDALEDEQRQLDELTELSQNVERIAATAAYRFSAARAYYALVERRIEELREERIEGTQTIREFMERRLSPAMRTCVSTDERIDRISRRLTRASQLLRTRVDIQLESQNRDLLRAMNRRAQLQLRLQETVEGLSVAAICYYLVSLINYALKAAEAAGAPIDVPLLTGLAILPVAALVWFGVRRIRRLVTRGQSDAGVSSRGP